MLPETVTVGAVGERQVQHGRIGHGLLQAERHAMGVVLGLHDGDRVIGADVQNIIRFLRRFPHHKIPAQIHLAVGELDGGLHGNPIPPALVQKGGRDVIKLYILFRHLALGNQRRHAAGLLCGDES